MCGRYKLDHNHADVVARFDIELSLFDVSPRYNIAPTQVAPVIVQDAEKGRILDGYRWGLIPSWAKDASIGNKLINARAETLIEKPSFRQAFKNRRCLVPVDGFYEWQKVGSEKQPKYIHERSHQLFAFAGLWEVWKQTDGTPVRTFTMVTTAANQWMTPIHHRMPVIVRHEDEGEWLDPRCHDTEALARLLSRESHQELTAVSVSRLVNSPAADSPQCIEPLAP